MNEMLYSQESKKYGFRKGKQSVFSYFLPLQSMDHRSYSASHSLQPTPNSTIHSLGSSTHPRLAGLWGTAQVKANHTATCLINPNGLITDVMYSFIHS